RGADHRIQLAALGGDVRVGEGVLILGGALGAQVLRVVGSGQLAPVQDVDRALGTHHRDLRGGPGQVDVTAEVLGAHDVIGAALGLAGDHGDLGDGGLGVGVQQLGAAADNAGPLLADARQEAGNVDEGEDRYRKSITGTDESGGLLRGVDVQAAGEVHRLVGYHPDRSAGDPAEADDDVR